MSQLLNSFQVPTRQHTKLTTLSWTTALCPQLPLLSPLPVIKWGSRWLVAQNDLPCWTERAPVWVCPSGTPGRVVWTASFCLSSSVEPVGSPMHAGASGKQETELKNKKQKTYLQSNNAQAINFYWDMFIRPTTFIGHTRKQRWKSIH